jgi:hypothetical protein
MLRNKKEKNILVYADDMRWAGHVVRMESRSAFKTLTGTPTGKRLLGRPRHR